MRYAEGPPTTAGEIDSVILVQKKMFVLQLSSEAWLGPWFTGYITRVKRLAVTGPGIVCVPNIQQKYCGSLNFAWEREFNFIYIFIYFSPGRTLNYLLFGVVGMVCVCPQF